MPRWAGFEAVDVPTPRGAVHARVGGSGPPVLLLHGYPQSHEMWWSVAPHLSERHTVVAADLPGYGASFRPPVAEDHAPHAKRALAADLAAAMAALGHGRFAVAGHDRGGRVAYRMALDAHEVVERLAVLDIVPTAEVWARADDRLAVAYWHWGFLAQPAPLPERMIGADPGHWFDVHVTRMGVGGVEGRYPPEVLAAYRHQAHDPSVIEAICEDYRAGATIDRALDEADRAAGRTIDAPVLALWGARGALPALYGDVLDVWRPWAPRVTGSAVDASHFLPEDAPEEVAGALLGFLA